MASTPANRQAAQDLKAEGNTRWKSRSRATPKTLLVLISGWLFLGKTISNPKLLGMVTAVVGMVAYGYFNSLPIKHSSSSATAGAGSGAGGRHEDATEESQLLAGSGAGDGAAGPRSGIPLQMLVPERTMGSAAHRHGGGGGGSGITNA